MRYLVILSFVTGLLTGCAVKQAADSSRPPAERVEKTALPEADYLWVFLPTVNVRSADKDSAVKLTQLNDGDSVAVMANRDGWYQIRTANQEEGWIRSDLLGPKNLSVFKRAVGFVDSLQELNGTEIYFDKKLYHRRIYIHYPATAYQSRTHLEEETRKVLEAFQAQVYQGDVTARVLKPGTEEEYLTLEMKGKSNADPLLPVVPFGIIKHAQPEYSYGISLTYLAPEDIGDQQLLKTARALSASYPLSYKKIEIAFVSETGDGDEICRLWFVEDSYGEDYKFDDCR